MSTVTDTHSLSQSLLPRSPGASCVVRSASPAGKSTAAVRLLGLLSRPRSAASGSGPPGRTCGPAPPARCPCPSRPDSAPAAWPAARAPVPAPCRSARRLQGSGEEERSVSSGQNRGWNYIAVLTHSWFPGGCSQAVWTAARSQPVGSQDPLSCWHYLKAPSVGSGPATDPKHAGFIDSRHAVAGETVKTQKKVYLAYNRGEVRWLAQRLEELLPDALFGQLVGDDGNQHRSCRNDPADCRNSAFYPGTGSFTWNKQSKVWLKVSKENHLFTMAFHQEALKIFALVVKHLWGFKLLLIESIILHKRLLSGEILCTHRQLCRCPEKGNNVRSRQCNCGQEKRACFT